MGDCRPANAKRSSAPRAEPMLDQVLAWAAVNSGSRNLAGLERMADLLADAFAALPGVLRLEAAAAGRGGRSDGRTVSAQAWPPPASDGAADGAGAAALHRPHGHGVRPPITRSSRRAGSRTGCSTGPASPT